MASPVAPEPRAASAEHVLDVANVSRHEDKSPARVPESSPAPHIDVDTSPDRQEASGRPPRDSSIEKAIRPGRTSKRRETHVENGDVDARGRNAELALGAPLVPSQPRQPARGVVLHPDGGVDPAGGSDRSVRSRDVDRFDILDEKALRERDSERRRDRRDKESRHRRDYD